MEFLSGIFHPIVDLMRTLVTYAFQLTQMVGYPSYGVAIILLTIVIKGFWHQFTVKTNQIYEGYARVAASHEKIAR